MYFKSVVLQRHMALNEHLCDSGCRPEITVDLERRMVVEQVRQCLFTQQHAQQLIRMVTIVQSVPHIDFPSQTPAGSVISPGNQRFPCCLSEFWRSAYRDLVARMECKQMGRMTVVWIHFFIVFHPFHYPPCRLTNPDRRQLG